MVVCYRCARPIQGKVKYGADRALAFHALCYAVAEREAERELWPERQQTAEEQGFKVEFLH